MIAKALGKNISNTSVTRRPFREFVTFSHMVLFQKIVILGYR